ncbi:unnamed protein product, partial [Iphiclides podalirius]
MEERGFSSTSLEASFRCEGPYRFIVYARLASSNQRAQRRRFKNYTATVATNLSVKAWLLEPFAAASNRCGNRQRTQLQSRLGRIRDLGTLEQTFAEDWSIYNGGCG